jgi:hypothetical protein
LIFENLPATANLGTAGEKNLSARRRDAFFYNLKQNFIFSIGVPLHPVQKNPRWS